ncbi:MAG: hypothetical protein II817_12795 [Bacteroidales bacterium]|nr:hypothetical protein [Bacteroidales bacterium]
MKRIKWHIDKDFGLNLPDGMLNHIIGERRTPVDFPDFIQHGMTPVHKGDVVPTYCQPDGNLTGRCFAVDELIHLFFFCHLPSSSSG